MIYFFEGFLDCPTKWYGYRSVVCQVFGLALRLANQRRQLVSVKADMSFVLNRDVTHVNESWETKLVDEIIAIRLNTGHKRNHARMKLR